MSFKHLLGIIESKYNHIITIFSLGWRNGDQMSTIALDNSVINKNVLNKDELESGALLQAIALNRRYGDYEAVSDFNLILKKGEVLGLLGPNGAGKSTTMQMLTGNISPSSGEVFINSINLIEDPESAKSVIGYLPEQPPIYKDMTVTEYLNYCAALRGIVKTQKSKMIVETSDRCGLQEVSKKLIGNLSKGFQQRVGIAQAILHQPEVVILDEPTVGLDPFQINQIRQLIRELGKDHAVILSTHILPEVQAVCDRVQIINQGETVFSDSFSELAEKQSGTNIIVSFKNSVDMKLLESLMDILEVKEIISSLKQSTYQLCFKAGSQIQNNSTAIYQLAVKQDWELQELSPQNETLEQIFMDLVYSEKEQNIDVKVDRVVINE